MQSALPGFVKIRAHFVCIRVPASASHFSAAANSRTTRAKPATTRAVRSSASSSSPSGTAGGTGAPVRSSAPVRVTGENLRDFLHMEQLESAIRWTERGPLTPDQVQRVMDAFAVGQADRIAAVMDSDRESGVLVKGNTGRPVRTLVHLVLNRAKTPSATSTNGRPRVRATGRGQSTRGSAQ